MSIDHEAGTCFVRYVSYGNEEEQELKDLQKISNVKSKLKEKESDAEVTTQFSPLLYFYKCCISLCEIDHIEHSLQSHRNFRSL